MRFPRQEYWSGLSFPSPGDRPIPGTEPVFPESPILQADSLPLSHQGRPYIVSVSSVAQSCPTLCSPWTAVYQASLSITNSWSLLKLMSIKSVMPPNHLILCNPLLLLPSIFPSIRVFSNESVLCIRWPKYWSFSFSISPPMNIHDWFPLGLTGLILQSKGLSRVFSNITEGNGKPLMYNCIENPMNSMKTKKKS